MASSSIPVTISRRRQTAFLTLSAVLVLITLYRRRGSFQFSSLGRRQQQHDISLSLPTKPSRFLPLVIWHGMGDVALDPDGIGYLVHRIQLEIPGIFVYSISMGNTAEEDMWASFFGDVNAQVHRVCRDLQRLPELASGWIGLGFSQGGQFLRAVIQRCNHLGSPAKRLITMGSQHQGVMDWPGCWEPSYNITPGLLCRLVQKVIDYGAFNSFVQRYVVQAQYFKPPDELSTYYSKSRFLADINMESAYADASSAVQQAQWSQYRANLMGLDRLVLFQFENDTTVCPKESSHFGFWNGTRLLAAKETPQYTLLGLDRLSENDALVLSYAPGRHMHISADWFVENVVLPHLKVPLDDGDLAASKTS